MNMQDDDNALSAIVVRNILDIEAAMAHANTAIEERLTGEWNSIFNRAFDTDSWYSSESDDFWEGWFCPKTWLTQHGKKKNAASYFTLETTGNDEFESWVATLTSGSEETGIAGLFYIYSSNKTLFLNALKALPDAVAQIQKAGFMINGDRIYFPLHIKREELALGFEADDLTHALTPFQKAADGLLEALPAFVTLHTGFVEALNA
tara:strand:+ start:846 stop:1463 length:618 start_codon:yes stop_codon:yes gene_type:complete